VIGIRGRHIILASTLLQCELIDLGLKKCSVGATGQLLINHNHILQLFSGEAYSAYLPAAWEVPWLNPDYGQVSAFFIKLLRYMQI